MPTFQTRRNWGTIVPDKQYELGYVDVRFTVPITATVETMELLAYPTIQKAIEQFEKIGKWQFWDKIPIKYGRSGVSSQALIRANAVDPDKLLYSNEKAAFSLDDFITDEVDMVARVWFIRPLIMVNLDEEREYREQMITEENGFVPLNKMPEEFHQERAKKEASNATSSTPE